MLETTADSRSELLEVELIFAMVSSTSLPIISALLNCLLTLSTKKEACDTKCG